VISIGQQKIFSIDGDIENQLGPWYFYRHPLSQDGENTKFEGTPSPLVVKWNGFSLLPLVAPNIGTFAVTNIDNVYL